MDENSEKKQDLESEENSVKESVNNECNSEENTSEDLAAINTDDSINYIDNVSAKKKKLRRNILIAFAAMLAFMGICFSLPNVINLNELLGNQKVPDKNEGSGTRRPIVFSPPKEPGFDIFEYEEYMGLDRNIYMCDPNSGVTESVLPSKVQNYGDGFKVIYSMINAVIEGDVEAYNSLMGKREEKKEDFTQQQLYNIKITKATISSERGDNGVIYNKYSFYLEYMIHENNGSFRRDIGSDEIKKQYIVVTNQSGNFLVDDILS